jgi:hypothetical protein
VQAVNVTGAGPANSAGFTTPPSLPGAPGVPSFSGITGTTATASWAAAAGTVAYYQYRLNAGAWTSVGTALAVNLTGLAAGSAYTLQVEAVNVTGGGPVSTAGFTTVALPSAPGTPNFSNITGTTATASWTAAAGSVASYQYRVNSGPWINVGAALTVNLTGLSPVTSYTVQVEAMNVAGAGAASSASFTTVYYTDTSVLVEGATIDVDGFDLYLGIGSMTPGTTTNGYTYQELTNTGLPHGGGWGGTSFQLSGFTGSGPGQSWLISVACGSGTMTGSSATYTYSLGTATWHWANGGYFGAPGTATCTIIHN